MDVSPLFNPEYLPIIIATLLGFGLLAAILLVPISRFLDREQEVAEQWTPEALAQRMREKKDTQTNGEEGSPDEPPTNGEEGEPSLSPS